MKLALLKQLLPRHTPLARLASTAAATPRETVLRDLQAVVASGKPIIGAGAGTGISAKFEEEGGDALCYSLPEVTALLTA